MRRVGFFKEDGFQVMGTAALTAFEFANDALGDEMYRLTVMSEKGGTIRSSLGIRIETEPLGDFPDTLMVVGELVPKPSPQLAADRRGSCRGRRHTIVLGATRLTMPTAYGS